MSPMMTGGYTGQVASSDDLRAYDNGRPDMSETSSATSSSEEGGEEDSFDNNGVPMPRISSSTVPIILEVAPRTASFDSKDPLFRGVCLYSGSMALDRREELESRPENKVVSPSGRLSRFLPSVFSRNGRS